MTLLNQIIERLRRVSDLTAFGQAIKASIDADPEGCIRMIGDEAPKNRKLVSAIVSEETLLLISQYLNP